MKYKIPFHSQLLVLLVLPIMLVSRVILPITASEKVDPYKINSVVNLADIKGTSLDGRPYDGAELKGKVVLLDFWAVWCGPCLVAIPDLKRLSKNFADQNVEVIGVASYSGTIKDVKQVLARFDQNYPIILGDPHMLQKFGVIGFPTYFLIDASGVVVKKYVGEVIDLYNQIANDTEAILMSRSPGK